MSIQSEISRINDNIATTYSTIETKGGVLPEVKNSTNLSSSVDSIPQTTFADTNKIGTIISYMGNEAPENYLICDGAEYNITDYPDLVKHFTKQFGNSNYFGGDGTTTFAVPDMRNLFLRGYHGEANESLSGNIGVKQEATKIPTVVAQSQPIRITIFTDGSKDVHPQNLDSVQNENSPYYNVGLAGPGSGFTIGRYYTSRPVNMAVLYCIKAKESVPAEEVYSTEETRIGTWIDGKPLYRKSYRVKLSKIESYCIAVLEENFIKNNIDVIVSSSSMCGGVYTNGAMTWYSKGEVTVGSTNSLDIIIRNNTWCTEACVSIEYTKTTD